MNKGRELCIPITVNVISRVPIVATATLERRKVCSRYDRCEVYTNVNAIVRMQEGRTAIAARNSASSPMAAALAKDSCTSPCTSSTSRHQVWSQIMSLQHPQIGKSHSIPTPPMSPAQQNFDGAPVCRLKGTAGVKRHRRHLHSITFTLAIGSLPHTRPA